jgi:hypothetical protein
METREFSFWTALLLGGWFSPEIIYYAASVRRKAGSGKSNWEINWGDWRWQMGDGARRLKAEIRVIRVISG